MAVRNWTKQQKDAIYAGGGNLLVSAAAGSGKTAVLTQRVLEKLIDPIAPTSIDRILACTFSNDAANEMRERISAALSARILQHPQDHFLRRQQVLLPTAQIGTVHSFCLKLMREHFHLTGLDPTFRVADGMEQSSLFSLALDEALEAAFAADESGTFSRLAASLGKGADDKALSELVERLYRLLMSCPWPEEWLEEKLSLYTDSRAAEDSVIWQTVFLLAESDFAFMEAEYESLLGEISDYEDLMQKGYHEPFAADLTAVRKVLFAAQNKNAEAFYDALQEYAHLRLVTVRNLLPEVRESCKARRDELKKIYQNWQSIVVQNPEEYRAQMLLDSDGIGKLFGVVKDLADRYAEKKKERQLVDFNDLEHGTLALLTEKMPDGSHQPSSLAKQIAAGYDEILLDEYQDINGVQEAIFLAVSKKDQNRFMVGDMKQGIYRFRLADPSLFAEKKERYTPYAPGGAFPAKIILGKNFRSRKEITDFINRIFSAIMTRQNGGLDYGEEDALVPAADYPEKDEEMVSCFFLESKERSATEVQAEFIAAKIEEMLENGTEVYDHGVYRPCRPSDFAILLRSVKNKASVYLKELAKRGVGAIADSGDAFFETKEISFLFSLLQAIDNPLLDLPLAAAMTGPVFHFTATQLAQITAWDKKETGSVRGLYVRLNAFAASGDKKDLQEKVKEFLSRLRFWRLQASCLTAQEMIRRILEETDLENRLAVMSGGAERVARVRQLLSLAAARENGGYLGLSGFVRLLADWQEKEIKPETALSFGNESCVRILSIHKSKGLEFPIVFLADLQKKFNMQDSNKNALVHEKLGVCLKGRIPEIHREYDTLPHKMAARLMRSEERSEEIRVLYVALTRAKERLYLVAAGKDLQKEVQNRQDAARLFFPDLRHTTATCYDALSLFCTAMAKEPDLTGNEKQRGFSVFFYENGPIFETKKKEKEPQKGLDLVSDPEAEEQIRLQMEFVYPHLTAVSTPAKRSVSQLKKEAAGEKLESYPADAKLPRPGFLSEEKISAAARGTMAHLVLEKADFAAARADLEKELQHLTQRGILTEKEISAVPRASLTAFFGSDLVGRMIKGKIYKEQRLLFRLPLSLVDPDIDSKEEMVLQGVADCIFETKDGLGILDYKTDRVDRAEELNVRYDRQLQLYAHGVEILLGRPVTELWIYSLTLDRAISVPLPKKK